jgi:hypothetical protein
MITTADATSPRVNDAFADYAQARGLFVDAARVRRPQDKPRVENQVAFVRKSWHRMGELTVVDVSADGNGVVGAGQHLGEGPAKGHSLAFVAWLL